MNDDEFAKKVAHARDLSKEEQLIAGKPDEGGMTDEAKQFMELVVGLLDRGEIDPANPESFLKQEIYKTLSEREQDHIDLALANIADMVRKIAEYYKLKTTPNESPQYQTMIGALLQAKKRVEEKGDVLKF